MNKRKNDTTLVISKSKSPINSKKKYWKWLLYIAYGPNINGVKIYKTVEETENNAIKWAERFKLKIVERRYDIDTNCSIKTL